MKSTLLGKGNSGMMEKWNNGLQEENDYIDVSFFETLHSSTPFFQYSY
jgi:hypothetical protein